MIQTVSIYQDFLKTDDHKQTAYVAGTCKRFLVEAFSIVAGIVTTILDLMIAFIQQDKL